jgi:ParB-like chromosome segregation protein Spo0J
MATKNPGRPNPSASPGSVSDCGSNTAEPKATAKAKQAPRPWRDVLPVHAAAEMFPRMSPDELRELGEDIRKHGLHEPIVLLRKRRLRWDGSPIIGKYDLELLDGRNRLDAMELVGFELIHHGKLDRCRWIELEPEPDTDPVAFVISANIRRRHLSAEDKRHLIAELLKAQPEKSDRQIAATVKASPTTIGTVRAEMEAKGDVSKLDTRRDTKGRKQPAKRSSKKPKPHARADIGADSKSEIQRLNARCQELENQKRQLEIVNTGLRSEIAELKAKIAELTARTSGSPPPADDGLDIPESLRRRP